LIIANGANWYKNYGTDKSPESKSSRSPGALTAPGTMSFRWEHLSRADLRPGRRHPEGRAIKAILPAGASSAIIKATEAALDTPMDYESVAALGSALGSASVIVIDETVDMKWLIQKTVHFFRTSLVVNALLAGKAHTGWSTSSIACKMVQSNQSR